MAAAALQSFRRTVEIAWPKHREVEGRKVLVQVARQGHAKIMMDYRAMGAEPNWEAYANTPGQTNLDAVILPGPIVYRYRLLSDITEVALTALQKASPVRSGLYAKSHTIFINGQQVGRAPRILKRGDQIMISNPVPYARRLEIGKTTSGRDFLISVPNRIYETVAKRVLIPKYRNMAKITFGYANIPPAWVIKGKLPSHYIAKGGARRMRRQSVGSTVNAPAIFIEPL
jgi:hypothetical protein